MRARLSASRSWIAAASTRCGWPSTISPLSASAPRCTCWARWPPRAPNACASARRCRWRRSIIRCASPRKWRCSTCCRAAGSIGAPGEASPLPGSATRAGRGFAHSEFNAFGVPPEESSERFREAVEIVLRAWTQERLSFQGAHFNFDGIEVLPKPLQQPHPPTWMAATSETAIDGGGSRGFSILMDPHASMTDLGNKRRRYAQKLAEAGFSDDGRDIPMARLLALAPTTSEAEAIARRGAQWLVDAYAGPQHAHKKTLQTPRDYGGKDPVQYYIDSVILHGTPAS